MMRKCVYLYAYVCVRVYVSACLYMYTCGMHMQCSIDPFQGRGMFFARSNMSTPVTADRHTVKRYRGWEDTYRVQHPLIGRKGVSSTSDNSIHPRNTVNGVRLDRVISRPLKIRVVFHRRHKYHQVPMDLFRSGFSNFFAPHYLTQWVRMKNYEETIFGCQCGPYPRRHSILQRVIACAVEIQYVYAYWMQFVYAYCNSSTYVLQCRSELTWLAGSGEFTVAGFIPGIRGVTQQKRWINALNLNLWIINLKIWPFFDQ